MRKFTPPFGRFDGVIGGPPCQSYGGLRNFACRWKHKPEHLIPEFERVIAAAAPRWFVMENVPAAPLPVVAGYEVRDVLLNNRDFGEVQDRARRFSFETSDGRALRISGQVALENPLYERTLTSAHGGGRPRMKGRMKSYTVADALALQGLPAEFFCAKPPLFLERAKVKMLAQGVPMALGRAVARAVAEVFAVEVAA